MTNDQGDRVEPPALLDRVAAEVIGHWSLVIGHWSLLPLGNRGGFSGARLWRVGGPAGRFCLRAWPAHEPRARVELRHRLMNHARRRGLAFVPTVFATPDGATTVSMAGRSWEVIEWVPGRTDFAASPSPARLEAACAALARLHAAWEEFAEAPARCPAVRRRLDLLGDWQALVRSGWRPVPPPADPVADMAERAWRLLARGLDEVPSRLDPWAGRVGPVQPCLCDLWHDHLLFEGDRLTGVVDYGAVKADHRAVDLARLLGSLVGDDPAGWQCGLRAYRAVIGLSPDEEDLARVLDRTGTLLGLVNWLRWLYFEQRPFEDRPAVARRLSALVERVERWFT
jgi:homoserine kinase type II